MKIKPFLQIIYGLTGLFISFFTALMTYIIIDAPIGFKMTSEIILVVLLTIPIILVFSYFIGKFLSKKFEYISSRLDNIDANKFINDNHHDKIEEITNIHNSINHLSSRVENNILELKENNKNLSTIIKSLSHDIKTPLTIIDGYLEELHDGLIVNEDIPKTITILKKETSYINELTSEVIGYIQSKEITSNKQEVIVLKDFLHMEVLPLLRVSQEVELKCEIDESACITFNSTALKKILINLLHNASKYTKSGSITTKVQNNNIIIEDTGVGIDPQYSKVIFEPFFGLDESRNREQNGFGLGLSIAKNLALTNGYELCLDTSYKDGSRFILQKSVNK